MGPIALFDKSFVQALSVDESVWFDHFFIPNVCPVFYIETLADLAKTHKAGRDPMTEVRKIAARFPECSSAPCARHVDLCITDLLGQPAPLTGQIPVAHGRPVRSEEESGVVFSESPEAEAFNRWYRGEFDEVEKRYASVWRTSLENLDLDSVAKTLRALGINGKTCRTLNDAKEIAVSFVKSREQPFERMGLAINIFQVPRDVQSRIFERWKTYNYPSMSVFAPYAAHVLSVEIFFQVALAANLISADRPSNRADIAYLFYLPFCEVFISIDKLHRKCAPLFMRDDQEFVWGQDLKQDLAKINAHFELLPDEKKETGIIKFARKPPSKDSIVVTRLWDQYLPSWRSMEDASASQTSDDEAGLAAHISNKKDLPTALPDVMPPPGDEDFVMLERRVAKRKGSWWQLPADLEAPDEA